jgi:hypothetical protein
MTHVIAKIGGWAQFGLQMLGQLGQSGTPHNWMGWLTMAGSLAAAIGIHAASNTDGQK